MFILSLIFAVDEAIVATIVNRNVSSFTCIYVLILVYNFIVFKVVHFYLYLLQMRQ